LEDTKTRTIVKLD